MSQWLQHLTPSYNDESNQTPFWSSVKYRSAGGGFLALAMLFCSVGH